METYLRIESKSIMGNKSKVVFVDQEGKETDISSIVSGVDVRIRPSEVNTATISVVKVKYALLAQEKAEGK